MFKFKYKTPSQFDDIVLTSDGDVLTGLRFDNDKNRQKELASYKTQFLPIFKETVLWLDEYFSGKMPSFTPKDKIENLTPFRKIVVDIMNAISIGDTKTYGEIANEIAKMKGIKKMSAQAVGGAVGFNPICIIVPCHRVVGNNGKLVGYGGGVNNKKNLLILEKQFKSI